MHALWVELEQGIEPPQAVDLLGADVTVGASDSDEVAGNQLALRGGQPADPTLEPGHAGLLRQ